jgi:hypothetical protein
LKPEGVVSFSSSSIENDFSQRISEFPAHHSFFQVLPDDMIVLAEPAPEDMVRAVKKAIDMLPGINPQVMHLQVKFNSQISTPFLNSALYHVPVGHVTRTF